MPYRADRMNPAAEGGGNLAPAVEDAAWQPWSPFDNPAPRFERRTSPDGGCLVIGAVGRKTMHSSWRCEIGGVTPQRWYAISAEYEAQAADGDAVAVHMIATWSTGAGKMLQRDYIDRVQEGARGGTKLFRLLEAPAEAERLRLDLVYRGSARGEVRWRNPLVREADAPPPRRVRVVSVMLNPYAPPRDDLAANRRRMLQAAEQAGRYRPDIVCFAETMVNRASGVPLAQAAEPIPGPSTEAFAATARKLRAYIVLSLHEVDDDGYLYNTAVLLDREGKIVGKYRKVHLTMYEWEAGLMPGDDYPVFDTDFGRIGILVCWDYWYPESARLLRLQGAEMVFIPTAGDARIQAAARAVENGMYVIVSGVRQSRILAPNGDVLCETQDPEEDYCVAEIDLNGAYRTHWLSVGPAKGEGRSLYVEERRPDTYGPIGYAARGVRAGGAHTGGAD